MQELKASFEKNQQQVNLNNPFGKCNSRLKTVSFKDFWSNCYEATIIATYNIHSMVAFPE
jgi:hypothetical protein